LTLTVTSPKAVQGGFTLAFSATNGTADGNDYVLASTSPVTFMGLAGETRTINVTINGDAMIENDETFTVTLGAVGGTTPTQAAAITSGAVGTGTILNDDEGILVVGKGGVGGLVRIFSAGTHLQIAAFSPFGARYRGGVRVATGDVNGDGITDVVTASAKGRVRVFDGQTFAPLAGVLGNLRPFGKRYTGPLFVAAGDLNGDGRADLVVAKGLNGPPQVRVFDGASGARLLNFFAFNKSFTGGVRVAVGDVNGDGQADIITGAGRGGSTVRVFNGLTAQPLAGPQGKFLAYSRFAGGVFVAAADLNGDGKAEIITGPGSLNSAQPGRKVKRNRPVRIFSGADNHIVASFVAQPRQRDVDVLVAAVDLTGDGVPDIVTGFGPGRSFAVRSFDGVSLAALNFVFATHRGTFVA
jgi:serralysin